MLMTYICLLCFESYPIFNVIAMTVFRRFLCETNAYHFHWSLYLYLLFQHISLILLSVILKCELANSQMIRNFMSVAYDILPCFRCLQCASLALQNIHAEFQTTKLQVHICSMGMRLRLYSTACSSHHTVQHLSI